MGNEIFQFATEKNSELIKVKHSGFKFFTDFMYNVTNDDKKA